LVTKASGRVDWMALWMVVERVYKLHSRMALQEPVGVAHLQVEQTVQPHHRKYHSHGGTHRIDKLKPVCWDCHRIVDKLERSK
jgi:hypothetical protein